MAALGRFHCTRGSHDPNCLPFLPIGIHPTTISDSFQKAAVKATQVLTEMSTPVTLDDRDSLLKSATTALNSKVICVGELY